jgi:hypothetical protein
MAANLPNQNSPDDQKLQELEKELQDLEKRAQGELNQPGQPNIKTQVPPPQQTPPTIPPPTTDSKVSNSSGGGEKGGMKTILWIAVILLLLSLVGIIGYYLGTSRSMPVATPTPTESPTPEPTEIPTEGWQIYESEDGWSVRYPEELEITEGAVVSFVMFGPTQAEGTEFYDGISLTFRSGALGGLTLEEFADQKAAEIEDDAIAELTSGPTAVEVAGLSGFTLTVTGLGTFDYYYLPLGETGYLEIVNATQDPTGQAFDETVATMFNSIEVLEASLSPLPTATASPTPTATP